MKQDDTDAIVAIPAVGAVEVKHGQWVAVGIEHETECSLCGFVLDDWVHGMWYNYCPNCGARMDGRGESNMLVL